jgi:hypothetical protein
MLMLQKIRRGWFTEDGSRPAGASQRFFTALNRRGTIMKKC